MGTAGLFDELNATSQKLFLCGTLTAGSLKLKLPMAKLNILQEGRVKKFVSELPEITFSGKIALSAG